MWKIFLAGGPVMWPLLACSILSLTVILERAWFWSRLNLARDKAVVKALLERYQAGEAPNTPTPGKKSAVLRMLLSGAAHAGYAPGKAMEAIALEEIKRMKRGMSVLDTVITIAPMLGILGTVTGIISSFDMLGQAGIQDPAAVVAGIAEALITTATGLMISIATVFPYNYYNTRIEDAQEMFEHYGTRLEIIQEELAAGGRT